MCFTVLEGAVHPFSLLHSVLGARHLNCYSGEIVNK